MSVRAPHPLDHLVLPVVRLDDARARLGALGFTVAPQGTHPFGTVNACVFFSDGTFLEPLAVGDPVAVFNAMQAGNAFVNGDAAYRQALGGNGFSALVLGSTDADADDAFFRASGIGGGKRLDFSRAFRTPAGEGAPASFRLAFASGGHDTRYFFTCERVNPPKVDRGALEAHANGVTGIRSVLATAADPAAQRGFWEAFTGVLAKADGGALDLALPNARLRIETPEAASRHLHGAACQAETLAAITFAAADLDRTAALLAEHGVAHTVNGDRLVTGPATGQGATFIFEE
ncbi:MAG: VOC family protein [Notoacmeibacter sp.]|nr:VOC family protein [Notoacmeibacter sp.]MCC0032689.1 VOC family protein [Brucellaceae bacterium]